MLGQAEIAPYFDRCGDDPIAIEEVFNLYIIWKLLNGTSCSRVLFKVHHLCLFLRVTGRERVLRAGKDGITMTSLDVALGCTHIGVSPATTPVGLELTNIIRRAASKPNLFSPILPRITTDGAFGGPAPVLRWLKPGQYDAPHLSSFLTVGIGAHSPAERDAIAERYFRSRPQFGTDGVPDYTSDRGTLPLYASTAELESARAELESVVRVLQDVSQEEQGGLREGV